MIIFQKFKKQKKTLFFLMSQGSFSPKIRFLGQKVCSLARGQTIMKVKTEDILSGFQDFFQIFIQPIINERSNIQGYQTTHFKLVIHVMLIIYYYIKCENNSKQHSNILHDLTTSHISTTNVQTYKKRQY